MRKILLVFFFAISIVLLLSPIVLAQDADVGVALLEMQLVSSDPILITPGGDEIKPDKYNSPSDIDTRVVTDTTPTCEEIFTIIDMKQKVGTPLSWYDQAMRARCIEQPIPEDDDKQDDYRPELSLAVPDTLSKTEGKLTRIEIRVTKDCCPSPDIPDCPTCGDRPSKHSPDVTRATQSANRPQSTHSTQSSRSYNVERSYQSTPNADRPARPKR